MAVTEKSNLNYDDILRYQALKYHEMFEPDQEKRKEISRLVRTFETGKNESRNKQKDLDEMFDSNSISNDETVEITGGRVK